MRPFALLKRLIFHPAVYYGATLALAAAISIAIAQEVDSARPLGNQRLFSFTASLFLPILSLLWGGRLIRDWIRQNKQVSQALGEEQNEANETFRTLVEQHHGPVLIENVLAYETFWTSGYRTDLNRHTIATAIVMASAIISISMGLLIFSRVPADGAISPYVTALGGALPALVTATSLKIWLETRNNLNSTRQQVDLLLRQRIRLILFWNGKEQFETPEAFEDHVHASSMFLDYLRAGREPEGKPERESPRAKRRAAAVEIPRVEILPN